jgi:orotate phosphoribosyltransferase
VAPERVIELYRQDAALLEGHFLLSSGRHSDTYLQSARVLQHPEHAAVLCAAMAQALPEPLRRQVEVVAGPAVGAILVSYETARALGVRSLFQEREGGRMRRRRGIALAPGEGVLVVEDVITTGGSTRECIAAVREAGGEVLAVASIIDRSGGISDFDGVPFFPLLRLPVQSWEAADCPQCAAGGTPVKPGSRGLQ